MKRILAGVVLISAQLAFAGFASNEVYLASIGRGAGSGSAQFYSTLWVTNLSTSQTVHFTFFFLKDGQSNLSGDPSFNDTLAPGQTKLYEDVTETKLSLPGQFGAARITADGEIFASERVYNLAHATDNLGTSEGLFFAAVPKSFAIGLGETASIQGVNQGSPTENMRTNFDLVETTGNSCKVHVTLLDSNGTSQGATDVNMNPFGHAKENAQALLHSVSTINDRIVATVTSGSGKVILAGEQLGNTSQDSSGFEMSFKDSLLGGGTGVTSLNALTGALTLTAGTGISITPSGSSIQIAATGGGSGGVPSVNGITGAVTIAHGANTTVNVAGNTITVDAVAGSGTGLTAVAHDNTLSGSGTAGLPLGIAAGGVGSSQLASAAVQADKIAGGAVGSTQLAAGAVQAGNVAAGQVVKSVNGLNDAVTLAAGSNVTITPSGQTLTIGSAGLTFPFSASVDSFPTVFSLTNTGDGEVVHIADTGAGIPVEGDANGNIGVAGYSNGLFGVFGQSQNSDGVHGEVSNTHAAVYGKNFGSGYGVYGTSNSGWGVYGSAGSGAVAATAGVNLSSGPGLYGQSNSGSGIYATSSTGNAGYFQGNITVTGTISAGTKDFKIDHPLDPEKKYLVHASVESNEMKNLYDGEVTLDASGTATVTMPDWFSAENDHVRYQLTALGTPQPGLFIASRLQGNAFRIAGGVPGAEVSWQVTGVRRDAYARAHPLVVEEIKSDEELGTYLHPELFGKPKTKSADPIQRERAATNLSADESVQERRKP